MIKDFLEKLDAVSFISITLGIVFGLIETWYFGGNMFPESHAEILCDNLVISLLFFGTGMNVAVKLIEKKMPKK